MSHPVFLDASALSRMPNGADREWEAFWKDARQELEANNAPPLLWWCLFSSSDLRRARAIDDEDIGSEERDALLDDVGADQTYPYLVTDQGAALDRLRQRRATILSAIGPENASIYDGFTALIEQQFRPFLLVRTSGMIDVADAEPFFAATLAELDALDRGGAPGPRLEELVQEIRNAPLKDRIWLLSGTGDVDIWPTADLDPSRGQRRVENGQRFGQVDQDDVFRGAAPTPVRTRNKRIDSLVEWLGSFVAAAAGLGTYYFTLSWVAAVGAFLVAALAVGVGIGWLRR
ncbi:hypothetical protein [Sphingomonas sp.]|uniref:hypothetical protein n=1 Tax=Sphingomonas sp. TaxID=28214 RepID=UPI003B3A07C0